MSGGWLWDIEPYAAWLAAGVILCIIELVAPGVFLLWVGFAALLTGALTFLLPISFEWQLLIFAVTAIASVYVGRRWSSSDAIETDDPLLNDRLARMIGETATMVTAMHDGVGRARVGDSVWTVEGPDASAETAMRITGSRGTSLTVEPLHPAK